MDSVSVGQIVGDHPALVVAAVAVRKCFHYSRWLRIPLGMWSGVIPQGEGRGCTRACNIEPLGGHMCVHCYRLHELRLAVVEWYACRHLFGQGCCTRGRAAVEFRLRINVQYCMEC